jgi:hypothetical protein
MTRPPQEDDRASVLQDWDLPLGADDVLRGQGANPEMVRARQPSLVAVAERALAEGSTLLRPAVVYRKLTVESVQHERLNLAGGGALVGPLVARHLAPARHVIAIVCTVGRALEIHAEEVSATDLLLGLALDGLGSAAVELLATAACQLFERQAASQGLRSTIPLSPGLVGWPVERGQQQIFGLLDASLVGVRLLSSGMMIPKKSVSMVLGLGLEVSNRGRPCDYCSMRETCRYRQQAVHAPGDETLAH